LTLSNALLAAPFLRTQHLVFFELDENRRLVDLPGYGYAKVPEHIKQQWQKDMGEYFAQRSFSSKKGIISPHG
jgi:GTP-binding protein EngB required for normal cell division